MIKVSNQVEADAAIEAGQAVVIYTGEIVVSGTARVYASDTATVESTNGSNTLGKELK